MMHERNVISFTILFLMLIFPFGCSERDELTTAPGSTAKADEALARAELSLKAAGIPTSFDDPGELAHPEDLVPNPDELGSEEKQRNFEQVIEQLNIVISEIEQEAQASPSKIHSSNIIIGSISDRGLVHFYLGLAYMLDALARLLISDNPKETFVIEFDPNAPSGEWFTFDVSREVKDELDAKTNPLDYPLAFTHKERQAIIDAADLIGDSVIKPRAENIQPRSSTVDRPPYANSALWHFQKASDLFSQYNPDLSESLEDFNKQVAKLESRIQRNSENWGFIYTRPPWR